jgi:hypothetical protein
MMQRSLISEAERQAYGDEALDVMARKAQEVVGPVLNDLNRQNEALRQQLQQVKAHDIYSTLDQNLPDWRRINQDQDWKDWLAMPDLYNGVSRQLLLNQAFAAGDADRVLTFFRGFLGDTQSTTAARAPRTAADNARPIITDKEIQAFYDRVRKGFYEGRSKDKDREEAMIHRAILEGRLRRTTS